MILPRIFCHALSSSIFRFSPRNFQNSPKPTSLHTLIRPFSDISINFQPTAIALPTVAGISSMASGKRDGEGSVTYQITQSSCLLKIQKGDITQWSVDGSSDAIVNPANERMLGGGGADGAIHRTAGPELRDACHKVPEVRPGVRCPIGEARITPGFRLPASHVIHTVGPVYDAHPDPKAALTNAYRNSLRVAKESNIQYIAFPAISCGVFRYPFDEAATVAISTVKEFGSDLKEVHFVLFSDEIYDAWLKAANEQLQN